MKRKLLTALILGIVALFTLVSCGGDGNNPSGNDNEKPGGGTQTNDNYLYAEGTTVRIIKTEEGLQPDLSDLISTLTDHTGKMPTTALDSSEAEKHEIAIGETSRPVSWYAKDYAESLKVITDDVSVFCIYAYNGSVAIWWSHDIDEVAEKAVDRFIKSYMSAEGVEFDNGPIYYETYDRLAYEKAREAAKREAQLDEIESILGKDARDAIADYLQIYRPEYYEWIANLYDPGVGGFYYSNSGRDTEGFLPDIESTVQALNWVGSNGMLENYGNDINKALPDWMKEQVLAFAMSLQSPEDGYFYHPQWGKNISTSRLSRDLMWATQIIKKLGGQVLYDAPNGDKGSQGAPPGVAPTAYLTAPLGDSTATAVSRVIATNTTHLPAHLQSTEAFRNYLLSFDYAESSYPAGNTITSQNSQILNAGKEYVAVFEEILNAKQEEAQEKLRDAAEAELRKNNPNATADEIAEAREAAQNGLWETRVSFDSVNGLMKISSAYNGLGVKMPYAKEAIISAMQMVYHKGADVEKRSPTNSVDVYNPWVSISAVISNVNKFYSKEEAKELRALVTENAAAMIRVTKEKISIFAKDDGSYGYKSVGVPEKSQGASVAVAGTNEGDINGGCIATNGTFGNMCSALGISKPNLYFNSDFEAFMEIIENLGPVKKVPVVYEQDPVTFDDDEVGNEVPMRVSAAMNGGYVRVVEDTRAGATGNVLEFATVPGTGQTMTTPIIGSGSGNCFVLEWDMNIKSSKKDTVIFQIRLGEAYMFTARTVGSGYTLGDSSSTDGKVSVINDFAGTLKYDEWYTIRIEHYTGTEETTKTFIFVNGEKVGESNNFFGKARPESVNHPEPKHEYRVARFYALYSADIVVHLDNIRAEKITKELPAAQAPAAPTAYLGSSDEESL